MTATHLLAWAFVVLAPVVVGAARFTIRIWRAEPSGVGLALAVATSAGAFVAVFVAIVAATYLAGAHRLAAMLAPGVVPAFLGLEIALILVPLYLRRLNGAK